MVLASLRARSCSHIWVKVSRLPTAFATGCSGCDIVSPGVPLLANRSDNFGAISSKSAQGSDSKLRCSVQRCASQRQVSEAVPRAGSSSSCFVFSQAACLLTTPGSSRDRAHGHHMQLMPPKAYRRFASVLQELEKSKFTVGGGELRLVLTHLGSSHCERPAG